LEIGLGSGSASLYVRLTHFAPISSRARRSLGELKFRAEVKAAAAKRSCAAVNADHKFGQWHFRMARNPTETNGAVSDAVQAFTVGQ
jgi:hypothetical protein